MKKPTKTEVHYTILPADAVAELQARFVARIDANVASMLPRLRESGIDLAAVQASVPDVDIKTLLRDFLIDMARLRADDDSFVKIERACRACADNNLRDTLKCEVLQTQLDVNAREKKKSEYGAAVVPTFVMTEFNAAAQERRFPVHVEDAFHGQDRIYLKIDSGVTALQERVAKVLAKLPPQRSGDKHGYIITDWAAGRATDHHGKQTFRIGKLLAQNHPALLREFENRSTDKLMVVISRRVEDIAYASTNRGWYSCTGAGDILTLGFTSLEGGIAEGSLIAYLISAKDPDILNPLARIMIPPFVASRSCDARRGDRRARANRVFERALGLREQPKGDRIWHPGKVYGMADESFLPVVEKFVEEKFNGNAAGSFWLPHGVYDDRCANVERKNGVTRKLRTRQPY